MATIQSILTNLSEKKQEIVFNKYNFIIFEKLDKDKVKRIHIIQKETKIEMFFTKLNNQELERVLNAMIEDVKRFAPSKLLTLLNNPNWDLNKVLTLLFK